MNTGKLCPTGWHVPSNTEWTTLNDFLGGDQARVSIKLREIGMLHWHHWKDENQSTNESGFTALAGLKLWIGALRNRAESTNPVPVIALISHRSHAVLINLFQLN